MAIQRTNASSHAAICKCAGLVADHLILPTARAYSSSMYDERASLSVGDPKSATRWAMEMEFDGRSETR